MAAERGLRVAILISVGLAVACATRGPVNPVLATAAQGRGALATADALEALIAAGHDTPADREFAYESVREREEQGAAYALARATVTGRLVQERGLLGANLVGDIEKWAQRSREFDPGFRDGAATRMLGTLYVIAPASFLKHGDSEQGLELLEGVAREYPNALENHLRLAEAYVALGDPAPAGPQLCACLADRSALRLDDQKLLDELVATAGPPDCVAGR